MFGLIITGIIIFLLALIMEVSATALKLTGMNIHQARFQALSALTGTGFTTHEAETIMNHKQRRLIIMILMISGPVGFVTILGSVLASVRNELFLQELLVILFVLFILIQFFKSKAFGKVFHKTVEKQMKKRRYFRRVVLDEVLQLDQAHGVCEVKIDADTQIVNKKLSETDFKEKGFLVLAIKRDKETINAPKGSDVLEKDDTLVIFGNIDNIKASIFG